MDTTDTQISDKSRRKGKKVGNIISSAVLTVAVLFCFYVLIQVSVKGYVSVGGYSLFRVVTGSMEPTISTGSLIISKSEDITKIKEGDIVCFRSKDPALFGNIITHRVVAVGYGDSGTVLRTQGDANITADTQLVDKGNFIGKTVWYSSEGNFMAVLLSVLTDKVGFFTIIMIPVILIVTLIINENIKKIKKEVSKVKEEADRQKTEEQPLTEEEIDKMKEQIRAELMEEMTQSAEETKADCTTEYDKDKDGDIL